MCSHRTSGNWGHFWLRFCQAVLLIFAGAELTALLTGGITLSTFLQRLFGLEEAEPCGHTDAGRVFVVGFSLWLIAHLGWGRLSLAPPRRRSKPPN